MIHLLGFPHTSTIARYSTCAYTDRSTTYATMLTRAAQQVILYGGPENEAGVSEFVPLVSAAEQAEWWPWYSANGQAIFNDFSPDLPGWRTFNERAAKAIRERAQPGDILAITMGYSHKPVWEQLSDLPILPVETGIGYSGVWAPYRVFESTAWRNFMAAKDTRDDMRAYDTVIPRAWLASDFPEGRGDGGYLLFVGRLTARKGPHVASEVAKRLGVPLWVAGQGVGSVEPGRITCSDGTILDGDVHYLGVLDPVERAKVMGGATAILTPTQYFEPLGGVSIEAQFTGTPAVVSNWGGLPENIIEGKTGFACDLLRDYVKGVERAAKLDRKFIRRHAMKTWSTDALAPKWVDYLARLRTLFGDGWYSS